jgi:hypothetical protein
VKSPSGKRLEKEHAMPAAVAPKGALSFGAGWLYWSLQGGAMPLNTVVGSVFTDVPNPAVWGLIGVTREGHQLTVDLNVDQVESAEYLPPLLNVTTGRTCTVAFDMMQINKTNFQLAINGGSVVTSGATTTLLTTVKLPTVGAERRIQLLWESTDSTERWTAGAAFQTGSIAINRRKGADNASLPVEFTFEPDANGDEFIQYYAGPVRGA